MDGRHVVQDCQKDGGYLRRMIMYFLSRIILHRQLVRRQGSV